jgi:structural maintenance of chromosome 2
VADSQIGFSIEEKRGSTSKQATAFAEFKAAYDAGVTELAKTEELLQTLTTGLSSSTSNEDTAGGYMGQLADAKARMAAAGTEAEQAKVRIGLAEKEINEKEPRAKKAEKEGAGLVQDLARKRGDVEKLRARVDKSGWDEKREQTLVARQLDLEHKLSSLSEVSLGPYGTDHEQS